MDLVIFEESKSLIWEALQEGEFDYMESASEVFETDFFRFIKAKPILSKLAFQSSSKRFFYCTSFILPNILPLFG